MRGERDVLRHVEAETISLIRYLVVQLELESDPGMSTMGGSAGRLGGWDGDGLNDDGGGDADAMARHQKRVTYKEENTLRPGDGGSAAHLFPALAGIENGERNSLPSKPKKMILPKKKKKFRRTKTGKNKKCPVAQVNTINE